MTEFQALSDREQKNLFYDAVTEARKVEEASRLQRINELRSKLYEYFDRLVCEGVIVPKMR